MSEFAEAILREKPDLPAIRGDMPDTWIHGIGSMPIETQLAHTTPGHRLGRWSRSTRCWGLGAPPKAPPEKWSAWPTRTRCCSASTLGGPTFHDMPGYCYGEEWKQKLAAGGYKFLLEGFDQKRAYARRAAATVQQALEQRMAGLAAAVKVPGRRVVVFNPLPWRRDGAVDVPWSGAATAVDRRCQSGNGRLCGGGRTDAVLGEEPPPAGLQDVCRLDPAITPASRSRGLARIP